MDTHEPGSNGQARSLENLQPKQAWGPGETARTGKPRYTPQRRAKQTLRNAYKRQLKRLVATEPGAPRIRMANKIALKMCELAAAGNVAAAKEIRQATEGTRLKLSGALKQSYEWEIDHNQQPSEDSNPIPAAPWADRLS